MIKYEPHIKRQLDALPSGKLRYTLKNDYMFKAVLQKNQTALTGLLSALLKIPVSQIESITILNPIELGKSYDAKDCMLDIKLKLNNAMIINIELQVAVQDDWPERSLTYLCRSFDQTKRGGNYGDILPTVHISILDFSLEHLSPDFYSEFMVCNTKNHEIYSDKFILYVLNLTVIEDDTIIKEPLDLYQWALLFKATTWEELKMLAEENTYIGNTIVTLHELTEDEKIQQQYEARERYEWDMASAVATGLRKGREEGEFQLLIHQICRKLQKNKPLETIAEELEEDPTLIRQISDVAKKYAPDYNVNDIYAAYEKEYQNQQRSSLLKTAK